MPAARILVAAALLGLLAHAATAQTGVEQPTQIQFQYHEQIPADGDSTPAFLKIIERIRQDCALVGKAFGRKCVITNINIYSNANGGEFARRMLNANATVMLPPEPAASSSPSSAVPSSAGAAKK